jgi:hypothetical protein
MDKFMIDKYIENNSTKQIVDNIHNLPIKQIAEPFTENLPIKPFVEPFTENLPIKPFAENSKIESFEIEQKNTLQESMFKFISIVLFLFIFVGFGIYYAVKYNNNENNYLIKQNAKKFDITLDELKTDIKNAIKEKYERFIDWKERLRTNTKKYIFNKHLENGAFKTTKYKATNLLSMFRPYKKLDNYSSLQKAR